MDNKRAPSSPGGMKRQTGVSPSDLFALKFIEDGALSPDGSYAVYSVEETFRPNESADLPSIEMSLWLLDLWRWRPS